MFPVPLLYLDFDGVLHPHDVRLLRGRPVVYVDNEATGHPLFEHVGLLEQVLEPYPALRIVLSTSWVRHLRFTYARSCLPPSLQARVIGATYHSDMRRERTGSGVSLFDTLTRYETITADARRRGTERWLALDDDVQGWPEAELHRVVAPTDKTLALGQPGKADELARALERLCSQSWGR